MTKPTKITGNALSCLVYCPGDRTFLLSTAPNSSLLWFPIETTQSQEWRPFLQTNLKETCGIDAPEADLLKLYKFWLPEGNGPFHAIFMVSINPEVKKKIKFSSWSKRKFKWCTPAEIEQHVIQGELRSLEVADCVSKVTGSIIPTAKSTYYDIFQLSEGSWDTVLGAGPLRTVIEVLESHIIVRTTGKNLNPYLQVVAAAGFHNSEQCAIYKYFLAMCFPCMYMNQDVFANVCSALGWNKTESPRLFRAGNVHNTNVLSFRDFLYIIAASEPNLQHGGTPAEVRCRYCFRYYDKDNNKLLQFPEFKDMVADIRKGWGMSDDNATLQKETESVIRNLGLEPQSSLQINDFLLSAGNLSLRGTSILLRSKKSLINVINESGLSIISGPKPKEPVAAPPSTPKATVRATDTGETFEMAIHSVKMKYGSTDLNVDEMWFYDQDGQAEKKSKKSKGSASTQFSRMLSVDSFNKNSLSNTFLNMLRNWVKECAQGANRQIPDLLRSNKANSKDYGKKLISLCDKVRDIFKSEPRMLNIRSPVFILGDLHGNFLDLLHFEKVLWNLGPTLTPGNFLFLGDYVDRGTNSVEVVTFLFSYKLQTPTKMNMLRGNHEVRNVQKSFTFYKECVSKFGEDLGSDVWEAVNKVFDCLPVAAVIDSKIFCCHGGIPPPWLCPEVSTINKVPVPLNKPEQQSPLAWDLMWNDPIREKKMSEQANLELATNDGFGANTNRGTAHFFTTEALQRFLSVNNFSHVIRAHEVQRSGFLVQQKGKLLTVFSSSGYAGGTNDGACVLAEGRKLRVFRLQPPV